MTLWKEYLHPPNSPRSSRGPGQCPRPRNSYCGRHRFNARPATGNHAPVHTLVDLTGISEMRALEIRGEKLFIGASVPHNRIVESPLAREHATSLVESCGLIGGPQVRNSATLGGECGPRPACRGWNDWTVSPGRGSRSRFAIQPPPAPVTSTVRRPWQIHPRPP